ncbi:carbonic anhydrase [Streptomyces sp. NPDC052236]|uniref:carbonic anhydrase n=1 Tax=Streptomyces sp. NPDC052236 TaxID=3365686 RepID=UPI0037D688F0
MAAIAGVATLTVFAATSCGTSDNSSDAKADSTPAAHASASPQSKDKPKGAHWSYEGAAGPANWATLEEDFEACETGREQSPVDLTEGAAVAVNKGITVDYRPVTAELVNNGHTVQATVSAGSRIVIDGVSYDLKQFHFHLPSEHTEDGHHAAMEMHFVHSDKKGNLAVLGVLMEEKTGTSAFGDLWKKLPAEEGGTAKITEAIDLTKFLPGDRDQYRYEGSLTTPPCAEGVKWTVLKDPVQVSPAETAKYRELFPKSNRPVQPLNDRKLTVVED